MIEREKAALEFFIAHQQFAKAVEPAVRHFNNPVPSLFGRIAFEFTGFLPAPFDMRHIAMRMHEAQCFSPGVAVIRTQVFAAPMPDRSTRSNIKGLEKVRTLPLQIAGMNGAGAGAAKALCRQRFPLAFKDKF